MTTGCPLGCRNGWLDSRTEKPRRCPIAAHRQPRPPSVAAAIDEARANAQPPPEPPDDDAA